MNEAERLLYDLVAIPSPSYQEGAAVAFLVAAMSRLGFAARTDEVGNAVGVRERPDRDGQIAREIMLLGHIDTVPGEIPVAIRAGKLYGRGAVDAKGALAAFVVAAARARLAPGTRLVVAGAVEEEAASSRGARHLAGRCRPDFCLIGEPSGAGAVTLGYKGRLLLDYRLRKPAGHSAGPVAGAAEVAVGWWQRLLDHTHAYNQGRERLFDQLLPSLRHIGASSDGLEEEATLTVGLRLPPGFACQLFLEQAYAWAGAASLQAYAYEPAYATGRRDPLAQAFARVWRSRGQRPGYKLKTGTSDMNVVAPIWRCPIVAYGPGDSRLDHTPDEHLTLSEYHASIATLQAVLEGLQR